MYMTISQESRAAVLCCDSLCHFSVRARTSVNVREAQMLSTSSGNLPLNRSTNQLCRRVRLDELNGILVGPLG